MRFQSKYTMLDNFTNLDSTVEFYSRVNALVDENWVVVDFGAGRANWYDEETSQYRRKLRTFKGRVRRAIGCDISPAIKENKSVDETYIIEDGRIPLEDNSVDLIIADWVLEHVEKPEVFVKEIDRILKPHGFFCGRTVPKWSYIAIAASIVPNGAHDFLMKFIMPGRKEKDVFPTYYRMNNFNSILNAFGDNYENWSYIHIPEPRYYFGKKFLFKFMHFFHNIMPKSFVGQLNVFIQKHDSPDAFSRKDGRVPIEIKKSA